MKVQGIQYNLTGERERGSVASYHRKPSPINHGRGAKACDIAGLKKAQRGNFVESFGDFRSKFTIGFEVEKNSLHRGAVKEYELFCGFETDGSCGYEAVTHILPLVPASTWRNKVFDMMHKASRIIEDSYSPSDRRCGGHITIAVEGFSGDDVRRMVRGNCGILFALFRKRLNNSYCGYNKTMLEATASNHVGGFHHKYQVALVKGNCLEFRLPSRFESVKQMIRRYELMHELVDFSVNKPNGSHEAFLKTIRPIIKSMYNGDDAKVEEVFQMARHFRKFIIEGRADESIRQYL
jgi:hypothetical protein